MPIYTSALLQYHGIKPWVPKNHRTFTKGELRPNPETPKTILSRNFAYNLRTKTAELPKLRTFKDRAPTRTTEDKNKTLNDESQLQKKFNELKERSIGKAPLQGDTHLIWDTLSVEITKFRHYLNFIDD